MKIISYKSKKQGTQGSFVSRSPTGPCPVSAPALGSVSRCLECLTPLWAPETLAALNPPGP